MSMEMTAIEWTVQVTGNHGLQILSVHIVVYGIMIIMTPLWERDILRIKYIDALFWCV